MAERPFDAITFDYWDTLVVAPRPVDVRGRRVDAIFEVLEARDVVLEADDIDAALTAVVRVFNENWAANRQFTYVEAVALLVEFLGLDPDEDLLVDLVDTFVAQSAAAEVALTPNIEPTLERLLEIDVPVAIICDVGLAPSSVLRGHLARHGVLDLFDWWSFSDEVGVYKPDPAIFRHALDGLEIDDPARVAHVGDLRRTDVAGARAMGMTSVRYRGSNDDTGADRHQPSAEVPEPTTEDPGLAEADHVIDDHADLLRVLGLDD